MPTIASEKETFKDTLITPLYGDIIIPQTEWSTIAGLGVPEDGANVTGDHILLQDAQPSATEADEGDVWYDSNDSNKPYKLVNGIWVSIRDAGAATGPDIGQWTNDLVFSVTDYRTVAWTSGTITLKDGTAYSIDAGDTGAMTTISYIYLDIGTSITVLQVTDTATSAVGANKLLVAVAKPNTDTAKDAEYQAFGGFGQGQFIGTDNLAANAVTANEITANTITANKMNIGTLSAISADMGTITAGTITIASGGFIRSGQTAYDTGTGWYMGNDSGTPRFSIGDGTNNYARFDGTTWSSSGVQTSQNTFTTGAAIDAGSVVAVESDGLIYRTRATGFSTTNTEQTLTTAIGVPPSYKNRLFDVSATMKALFYTPSSTVFALKQIATNAASSTISSVTSTTLNSSGNPDSGADAVMINDTDAVVCWLDSGGTLRARYVSSITGTVSLGSTISVVTANNNGRPCIVKVSATEVLILYNDTATDISAISVSISGTTLTAGSSHTVINDANTYVVRFAEQFGDTGTYAVCFNDTTNTKAYIMAFTFSGTTLTPGTPVHVVNYTGSAFAIIAKSFYLSSTTDSQMALCARFDDSGGGSGGDSVYLYTYNLSGTTLALGVQTVVENIGVVLANSNQVTLTRIARYTYAVGYADSTTTTVGKLYNLVSDTFSIIGSELAHTGIVADTAIPNIFCYYSPTRVLMVGTSAATAVGFAKTIDLLTNIKGTIGLATDAAAASASAIVILGGSNTDVSGLDIGEGYYASLDGELSAEAYGGLRRIGVASSATNVIVGT